VYNISELPTVIPVFPLSKVLLLPGTTLPLNIFEPRYLRMVEDALAGERIIGMLQPSDPERMDCDNTPSLEVVGCAGRITKWSEKNSEQYFITLQGVIRFRVEFELPCKTPYRQIQADYSKFSIDLTEPSTEPPINRDHLISGLSVYLKSQNLTADWSAIEKIDTVTLVNVLSVLSPFSAREKQALLEVETTAERCNLLVALAEMTVAQTAPSGQLLQ
jgi:Lon protease-like protein